jgi:predicted ester cyclase
VAEGDKVVTRWSARGTHLGEWQGLPAKTKAIPPSGRHVTFSATDIYLISSGKIVEEWNTLEQLDVLFQIGAIPSLEAGG